MKRPSNINEMRDDYLVELYQAGNNLYALETLYKRYMAMILFAIGKYFRDANEALQTCSEIFDILESRVKTEKIKNFRTWLNATIKIYCLNKIAGKTKRNGKTDKSVMTFMKYGRNVHLNGEFDDKNSERLRACLDPLPAKEALVIRLFYLEEMNYSQILESTRMSKNDLMIHLHNGRRNFRYNWDNYQIKNN